MRTKVEIGDFEITIEEDDNGMITVSAEKDGETVEDFTLGDSEESDVDIDAEDGDDDGEEGLKPFGADEEDEEDEGEGEEDEPEATVEKILIFGEKVEKIVESVEDNDDVKDFGSF